jgi:hypothetical protein
MNDHPKKKLNDPKDVERLARAAEEYFSNGTCAVLCSKCATPIVFRKLGREAWEHHCSCGRFNGTMRGL